MTQRKAEKKRSRSIALYDSMWKGAEERAARLGFRSLSEYVETVLAQDLRDRPSLVLAEDGWYFTQTPPAPSRSGAAGKRG